MYNTSRNYQILLPSATIWPTVIVASHCAGPAVCLSICGMSITTMFALQLFTDFSYQLEICWMMQIAIKMAMLSPFCVFHGTLKFCMIGFYWPGLMDDVTTLTLSGSQLKAWHLVRWCTVTWSISLLKIVMLSQFLGVSASERRCYRSYSLIWWDDAQ